MHDWAVTARSARVPARRLLTFRAAFRDAVDDLDKVVIKVLDLGGDGKRCYGKHGSISGKGNGNPDTGRRTF